jgi:hypothetical protein
VHSHASRKGAGEAQSWELVTAPGSAAQCPPGAAAYQHRKLMESVRDLHMVDPQSKAFLVPPQLGAQP